MGQQPPHQPPGQQPPYPPPGQNYPQPYQPGYQSGPYSPGGGPPGQPPNGAPPKKKRWPIVLAVVGLLIVALAVIGFIFKQGQEEYRKEVSALCDTTQEEITGILETTQDESEVFAAAAPMIERFGQDLAELDPATADEDAVNEYLNAIQALPDKLLTLSDRGEEGTSDTAVVEISDFATTLITAAEASEDLELETACGRMVDDEAQVVGLTGSTTAAQ